MGDTPEEEQDRSKLWVIQTLEHAGFPAADNPDRQIWALQRLYHIRVEETAAYRRTTVRNYKGPGAPSPISTSWPTVHDEEGYAFYKACDVGLAQWTVLQKQMDDLRTRLQQDNQVGAAGLVPKVSAFDADLMPELRALHGWLISSACQDDLEQRDPDDATLCDRASVVLKKVQADVDEALGVNKDASERAAAISLKQAEVQSPYLIIDSYGLGSREEDGCCTKSARGSSNSGGYSARPCR